MSFTEILFVLWAFCWLIFTGVVVVGAYKLGYYEGQRDSHDDDGVRYPWQRRQRETS